jgi:Flp pilus assembly protein TadG
MTSRIRAIGKRQEGVALIYIAVTLTTLLLFSGLAVDGGRGYVVKAQLSKAVDGAALAAARNLNSGDPAGEAARIFKQNFPLGFMGTTSLTDPTTDPNFYHLTTDAASGVNTVTINASATLPTSFMKLGNINTMTVNSMGEATRRMVDLSLVVDVSGSIGSQWATVADATEQFIDSFDAAHDRMSLTLFSTGAEVRYAMPSSRGFSKSAMIAAVPSSLPGGSTLMAEGLYRGWDQLRTVSPGQQSGLRIIVLFTDGATNGVPGNWGGTGGAARAVRTADFPWRNDPDAQTWDCPGLSGVTSTSVLLGGTASPSVSYDQAHDVGGGINACPQSSTTPPNPSNRTWNADSLTAANMQDLAKIANFPAAYQHMPPNSWHTTHASAAMPTSFPFFSTTLKVDGTAQNVARSVLTDGTGQYPTTLWNVNNAARNLLEIIADAARSDASGDYPIRIYTIGMGNLVTLQLGTRGETSASILERIANDPHSPDKNTAQLFGAYFYAPTAADVANAYQGIQNQILRLSK